MPIISFNYDKISTERKLDKLPGKVDVSQNLNIKNIRFDELKFTDSSEKVLRFEFEFNVVYGPDVGATLLAGHLLYTNEKKKLDEIEKLWKKDKKLSNEIATQVFNNILVRCNLKALQFNQDVNLPPHINLPLVRPPQKDKKEDYIG